MNTIMQLQDSGDAMPCQAALTTLVETQHSQCLMCGPANPAGLKLKFKVQADGSVLAAFPCRQALQSYPNTLHGGIVAALLDSAMTNALFAIGVVAVTAELTVRYQAPVNPERVVVLRAGLEKPPLHPLYYVQASLEQDGQSMARASAKFLVKENP